MNEAQQEQLCLHWFQEIGYEQVFGPDIACDGPRSERQDYRQVVLLGRLLSAPQHINPHLPPAVRPGPDQARIPRCCSTTTMLFIACWWKGCGWCTTRVKKPGMITPS